MNIYRILNFIDLADVTNRALNKGIEFRISNMPNLEIKIDDKGYHNKDNLWELKKEKVADALYLLWLHPCIII